MERDAIPERQTPDRPRGDATRQALIEAGLELFGERGYHAASSRALAEAAGVNQALIGYHFGGKRGLYLAVFEHIGERMIELVGPTAASIVARLDNEEAPSREMLFECLFEVIDRFVLVFTSAETRTFAMLVVREQQNPGDAFDILWQRLMGRMLQLLTRLVAGLRGAPPTAEEVRIAALTVIGQVLVFRMANATARRHLEWQEIDDEGRALIRRVLRQNLTAMLSEISVESSES